MGLLTDYYGDLGKLVAAPESRKKAVSEMQGYAMGRKAFDPAKANIAEALLSFSPVLGDVLSAKDTAASIAEGNYGEAALNGAGLLPFIPGFAGSLKAKWPKNNIIDLFHGTDAPPESFFKHGILKGDNDKIYALQEPRGGVDKYTVVFKNDFNNGNTPVFSRQFKYPQMAYENPALNKQDITEVPYEGIWYSTEDILPERIKHIIDNRTGEIIRKGK